MPDARCTRDLVCNVQKESAHTSIQGSGEHPTFPAQWLYGLYELSPENGSFASVAPWEAIASRSVDASTATSGPHAFAVRVSTDRQSRTTASTASHRTVVAIMI